MATFTGTEGALITLAVGKDLTGRFRGNFPTQPKGRFFGKDILNTVLAQAGAKGIRFYFGQDADGTLNLVMCGATSDTNDMLNKIADLSVPCPSVCSTPNDLNS